MDGSTIFECDFLGPSGDPVDEGLKAAASLLIPQSFENLPPLDLHLHPKQMVARQSEATEILFGGAAGGGKSHLLRVASIYWCTLIPGLNAFLFRRISEDLWKNHMTGAGSYYELLAPWIDAKLVKISKSPPTIEFLFNGSKIHLCHCQYEDDRMKYLGAEIHLLLMDELTTFTSVIFKFLRSRVRLGGLRIPEPYRKMFPRILCGSNPGGIGHNWVREAFITPVVPLEIRETEREEGGLKRQFIPSLLEDNPTMAENDPDYEMRLEGLGSEHWVKALRYGLWDIVAGGMFDDVWDESKHVVRPFVPPLGWTINRTFDYGSSAPFSVCWWAESNGEVVVRPDGSQVHLPKGSVVLIAEWYGWNGEPNQGSRMLMKDVAKGIREKEERMLESKFIERMVDSGPADSSIYTVEDGKCIADEMGLEGISWTPANKSPGSRIAGWEKMRRMLNAAKQHPMEEPGLLIFNTCRHFIRTIPVLPRDPKNEDDVDTNAEDHIGDATRYRLVSELGEIGAQKIW
jgi:hypothetical protein